MTAAPSYDSDVIVVGAGPGGSSAAYHLAQAGLDVALLEKTTFPREKVCGDGLTPRAVKALVAHGRRRQRETPAGCTTRACASTAAACAWRSPGPSSATTRGTGWSGRGRTSTTSWPARRSRPAPGCSERTNVTGPVLNDERPGRRRHGQGHRDQGGAHLPRADRHRRRRRQRPARPRARPAQARRPADGRRLPALLHQPAARRRLAGVAGSSCGTASPARAACCPATAGSSAWATARPTSASASSTPARRSATSTTATCCAAGWPTCPGEWGYQEDNATGPIRGAALPMGFNRTPAYTKGVLLVGDSAGTVNPMNGEGIPYAMESGEMAARAAIQALARSGAGPRAGARGLPERAQGRVRRLLHRRQPVRQADRQPLDHEARAPATACRTRP